MTIIVDERHAYAECETCSKQILVEMNIWLNLASGAIWCFDPEELPEGWTYTVEPYPASENFIYCPEHTIGVMAHTEDGTDTKERELCRD